MVLIANQKEAGIWSKKNKEVKGKYPPKNKIVIKIDIKIILEYSAKKNKAKDMAEYSTLNPDTSSDSPSVKSKGVRFVSANADTKHIINTGIMGKMNQIVDWDSIILVILKEPTQLIIVKIITPNDTS